MFKYNQLNNKYIFLRNYKVIQINFQKFTLPSVYSIEKKEERNECKHITMTLLCRLRFLRFLFSLNLYVCQTRVSVL